MRRTRVIGALGSTLALGVALGAAPPAGIERAERAEAGVETDRMRENLERRLGYARESARMLEEAISRLDAGEDPVEVRRQLFPRLRGGDERRAQGPPRAEQKPPPGADAARGRGPRADRAEFTEQTRARVRTFIAENLPTIDEDLRTLESVDPNSAYPILRMLAPRVQEVLDLRARDAEMAGLKLRELVVGVEIVRITRRIRLARFKSTEASEAIETELLTALAEQYDTRLAIKKLELARLRDRAARLEEEIARAGSERETELASMAERIRHGRRGRGRP